MLNIGIITIGILAGLLLFSSIPTSESTLWDLLIDVNLEKDPIDNNESPIVFGKVIDHAGKPVSDVEVKIRLGQESFVTTTNSTGDFIQEFSDSQRLPGIYIVNVVATSSDDKIGIASTEFRIQGESSISSRLAQILSSDEALRYLHANPEDFGNDPIGQTLYNYYQDMKDEFIEQELLQQELWEQQEIIDEERQASLDLLQIAVEEENPSAGTYSGWMYDRFVSNLDLSVKDIIVNQLNYTTTIFAEAQKAMNDVLENGGTLEDARLAYFEKATISRDLMNILSLNTETSTDLLQVVNSTEIDSDLEFQSFQNATSENLIEPESNFHFNVNGTTIEVGMTGTTIYLNVNGTIIELVVNGTEISQITNSSQN